jgi:hypothetical protein
MLNDYLNLTRACVCQTVVFFTVWVIAGTMAGDTTSSQAYAENPATPERPPLPFDPNGDGSLLLAIVERDPILLADVRPKAEQFFQQAVGDQKIPQEEADRGRIMLIRRVLNEFIQMKVLYRGFIQSIAGSQGPDKAKDAEKQVKTRARKYFYEDEIPRQLKDRKLDTIQELDAELRKTNSTVDQLERQFIEAMAGSMYMRDQVPQDPAVTPDELIAYFQEHSADWDRPARARWEQLTLLFSEVPNRDEALARIAAMGNEALFGGNMQAVAKQSSQEPLAASGGVHDWTRRGSLRSKALDEAIFTLPVNKLSAIIEDEAGVHIIRVLEREDAGRISFAEAQPEIRKKIQNQKRSVEHDKMTKKLKESVPVWSVFPEDYPGALPLQVAGVESTTTTR